MPTIIRNGETVNISVEEFNAKVLESRKSVIVDESGKLKGYDTDFVDESGNHYDMSWFFINGEPFYGISTAGFLTVNTKTYVEEPTRTNDGSMPNINDYETFIVPRAKFNLKYFSIEDYQRLCSAIMSNEFWVKYYDKQFGKWVEHKMYAEPEEMAKIYNVGSSIIGVLDYEISFIGTLNGEEYTFAYNGNYRILKNYKRIYIETDTNIYSKGDRIQWAEDGNFYEAIYEEDFSGVSPENKEYWKQIPYGPGIVLPFGEQIILESPENIYTGDYAYLFAEKWNTKADGSGVTYYANQKFTIFGNVVLYPMVE